MDDYILSHTVILPDWTFTKWGLSNPALLGTHRKSKQKEFLKSCEGFLRAPLIGHSHPGPFWKIAKMALFDPCMEFKKILCQMKSFEMLWKYHCLTLLKTCLRLIQLRPSAYLREWIRLSQELFLFRVPIPTHRVPTHSNAGRQN